MHGNGCDITDGIHIPDLAEQLLFGIYMVWILRKKSQQVKLLCGKDPFLAVHVNPPGGLINLKPSDLYDIIDLLVTAHQPVIACHMRLHSRHKFRWAEGLCHIVIRTKAKTPDLVNIVLLCRHHDNRNILFLPNLLADFKTVDPRQH